MSDTHPPREHARHHILWITLAVLLGVGIASLATDTGSALFTRLLNAQGVLSFHTPTTHPNTDKSSIDPMEGSPLALATPVSPYTRLGGGSLDELLAVATSGKFIHVDLEKMTLTLIHDGAAQQQFSILSKGRPGSPWETPAGLYEIRTKEENHFSSIGHVWMPYSMQFFGNFFIHGWPNYSDGTPVPEGFSGGCIRMSGDDAEQIFNFAEFGTPVYVHTNVETAPTYQENGGYYTRTGAPKPPLISAQSFLVADLDTREVLLSRDINTPRPIASVTKLMTALTSLEVLNQFLVTTVSRNAVETDGVAGGLVAGERISVGDLIYPLLLPSSNDAAEALAEHMSRNWFIRQMNEKARSIGMHDTHYDDPSGLSPENVSTVRDLFALARHLYRSKRHVLDLTLIKEKRVPALDYGIGHAWENNNYFITRGGDGYIGGKTGFTDEAFHTLVGVFKLPLDEFEDRTIVVILLGSQNGEYDARQLLSYLNKHVVYKTGTSVAGPIIPTPAVLKEPTAQSAAAYEAGR